MYHTLLKRQLKQTLKETVPITPEWEKLLSVINRSYEHYERDHILTQHSLNLSSQELAEKESRIRSIIDVASDGIIVMDAKGKIETCNQAASVIFGVPENKIVSDNILSFVNLSKKAEDVNLTFPELVEAIENKKEFYATQTNGKAVPLELKISQSMIANEIIYVMLMRDVTQQKIDQDNLEKLHNDLMLASRLAGMGEVAKSMLHNIGNILNSVFVSVQLIIDKNKDNKIETISNISEFLKANSNNLEKVLRNTEMGKLLPQLLEEFVKYSKENNQEIEEELNLLHERIKHIKDIVVSQQFLSKNGELIEEIDINYVLEDAVKISIPKDANIAIHIELKALPVIQADKVKLMQILVNLIKNSVDSLLESKKENPILNIKTQLSDPETIKIDIADNGVGIEKENLDKIFYSGFTTKARGHGIGLHSSAIFLQQLGGKMSVESKGRNEGAVFSVFLPINSYEKDD